MRIIIKH